MEYTIQKLSQIAGVSTRTLRYYDEIGLLKPARINSSGYRIYGTKEVDRLQHILFYRELGMGLEDIQKNIDSPERNDITILQELRQQLLEKKAHYDLLIANVENTLAYYQGGTPMSDKAKFEGLKQKMVRENEEKYGREVREKYGNDVVDQSNQKVLGMTQEQYDEMTKLSEELMKTLECAFLTGEPGGELAQKAADLHRQWLCFYWQQYSKEAHAGVARMYVEDPRFTEFYDKERPGTAAFLRDAILIYTGM
ncbi:MerR family transcriptional regulator [Dehalobacter sp. DCM]|uniref:MerR family transcriptional regulator n=1 Tax=Dehalobacter sp. DCM TaxID=2907827 RepID=UPI003081A655|nr:MerR family transcriptional regulator [Dehalobacter sp. DCM]